MGQFAAGEHHAVAATDAFQTDISAQAHDLPVEAAAGVRLAQTGDISNLNVR